MSTHTESSSEETGELSPQQQPFSSVAVGVPQINLAALPPASPLEVQPATPGHSSSSADKFEQGGEDLTTTVVMTPSATVRRQEESDVGEVSIEKIEQKHDELRAMFRTFMDK